VSILEKVISYQRAGLCVLPALRDEKRPAMPRWKNFQKRLPTEQELHAWFSDADAVCLITGAVSGNLELIDFDLGGELFDPWAQQVRRRSPALLDRLVIERSQSGGRHVVYRCAEPICGNLKLAQRVIVAPDDQPIAVGGKTFRPRRHEDHYQVVIGLIETRGEGGLFLCDPTPGYELLQGRFEELPVLTAEERNTLLDAAWSLNESSEGTSVPSPTESFDNRPGDDFNARGDVRAVLKQHGWTLVRSGENEHWCRPGKDSGCSATLKDGVFYVFSSNAAPFEPNRGYSPFAVYATLEHNGDFTAAARMLQQHGYGQSTPEPNDVDLSAFNPSNNHKPVILDPPSIWELIRRHPNLREPVIHGLLRRGETMNVIAPPKTGKSWLVNDLALAIATGKPWLGTFQVARGDVLILDNELHPETTAHRIPKVADKRGILIEDYGKRIFVQNMRGRLENVFTLGAFFKSIKLGRYRLIILDAFYRFMPRDMDENDNGTMANIYNHIDQYADQLDCSFVLIHHATKGNQSAKAVTDVGAGAGSQSRATDTHLVLRPHEEPGAVVLEAAVRSWPPIDPVTLRWEYPLWEPAHDLDPAQLRNDKPKRKSSSEEEPATWTPTMFASQFVTASPQPKDTVIRLARQAGMSVRVAERFLREAEGSGLIHRWYYASNLPVEYATVPQVNDGEEYP